MQVRSAWMACWSGTMDLFSPSPLSKPCASKRNTDIQSLTDQESAALTHQVAELLYPSYSDSKIPQVIKYEKDIVLLRKAIQEQRKADELAKAEARHRRNWKKRVLRQGGWDDVKDPLPLTGAPALPMPVTVRCVAKRTTSCPSFAL